MARHGGSMGPKVSMLKCGSGGGGMSMILPKVLGAEKFVPSVMDDLPQRRGAPAARMMDGRHDHPWEHASSQRRPAEPGSWQATFPCLAYPFFRL